MKNMFDLQHPFFRQLWRRIAVTAIAFAWAGVEYASGAPAWAALFAAAGAWCVYQFFVIWTDPPEDD
ncbi:MAG: hypothetical protein JXQ91_05575 [Vannielia sp.]|uniref:hypothetical protein n=1 Tax=Rhodobacterales TaxID=204455 RepID=UPI002095EFA9|nr:hypothetical protein [Oceanicola sp. 502str15]MCO6381563.1 hypothetical protein [Oceanicola sp. 502str15]